MAMERRLFSSLSGQQAQLSEELTMEACRRQGLCEAAGWASEAVLADESR